VSFSYRSTEKQNFAHPYMVRQEGTHGPDDNGCEAEGNSTPYTLAKSMTKVFDTPLARQHREMESRCDDHKKECNRLEESQKRSIGYFAFARQNRHTATRMRAKKFL
jgi:hypothetical protein